MTVTHGLATPEEAAALIRAGRVLVLAGTAADLATLPHGQWIGGTAASFLTQAGGREANGRLFYSDLSAVARLVRLRHLSLPELRQIGRLHPANGFTLLIVPGFSQLLAGLCAGIMDYEGIYNAPLFGWVSAVAPYNLSKYRPQSFAGGPAGASELAAVMSVTLPDELFAEIHIANLFNPGVGPEIRFPKPGFVAEGACQIGGETGNLAQYMEAKGIDQRLPLVADHDGALINLSILASDPHGGTTTFLAPVDPGLTYRFAEPVLDYPEELDRALVQLPRDASGLSSVCLQNYLHGRLRQAIGLPCQGPVSFGQIAYNVLNQTLACLRIGAVAEDET